MKHVAAVTLLLKWILVSSEEVLKASSEYGQRYQKCCGQWLFKDKDQDNKTYKKLSQETVKEFDMCRATVISEPLPPARSAFSFFNVVHEPATTFKNIKVFQKQRGDHVLMDWQSTSGTMVNNGKNNWCNC